MQAQFSEDELLYYYYLPAGLTKAEAAERAKAAGWSLPANAPTMVLPYASGLPAYWLAGENRFIDPISGQLFDGPPLPLSEAIEKAKQGSPLRTTQEKEIWDVSQNLLMIGGWDQSKRPLAVWVGKEGVKNWTYLDEGISATEAEKRSIPYNFQWVGQAILEESEGNLRGQCEFSPAGDCPPKESPVWSMRAITAEGELVEFQVGLQSGEERVLHLTQP